MCIAAVGINNALTKDISLPAMFIKHSLISSVSKPADVNNTLIPSPVRADSSVHR